MCGLEQKKKICSAGENRYEAMKSGQEKKKTERKNCTPWTTPPGWGQDDYPLQNDLVHSA